MTRWVAAGVIGIAAIEGIPHSSATEATPSVDQQQAPVCNFCSCRSNASAPQRHPGAVNIDAYTSQDDIHGTGIILDRSEILTNDHVIQGATEVCVIDSQHAYPASVVGEDPDHDVALLRTQGGLTPARIGDSNSVSRGDHVTTVGNNVDDLVGETQVVGLGVSAAITDDHGAVVEHLDDLIKTSGGMLPGDSGGPLADTSGRVVGVSTASTAGRGFAIGINNALAYVKRLRNRIQDK